MMGHQREAEAHHPMQKVKQKEDMGQQHVDH